MKHEDVATKLTAEAASKKDYLIRSKHNQVMREAARRMMLEGGFFYGTEAELREHYADTFSIAPQAIPGYYRQEVKEKRVWACLWNITWKKIYFVLV